MFTLYDEFAGFGGSSQGAAAGPTTVDEQGRQVLTERGRGVLDMVECLEQLLDEVTRG